ncbi:hypothetical protein A3K73_07460 [Candidatus Pacearchaeota archaeon RBG_13_36_9]|nr:MAG: hypothetical protein A3K73_07460 [Candidatus Pacearchaeota archaeon RBG_13_36_9]
MKKRVWITVGFTVLIILVVLGITVCLLIQPKETVKKPFDVKCCEECINPTSYAPAYSLENVTCATFIKGGTYYWNVKLSKECQDYFSKNPEVTITDCYDNDILLAGLNCSNVTWWRIERCCSIWAKENKMEIPACEGSWVIENNQCSWKCGGLIGGCAGVSAENLRECCNNWVRENNVSLPQCVGEWEIKNNQCSWKCGLEQTSNTSLLQNCSGGAYSTDCPEGYYCYEHLTGGLGPEGALPIEPYGGDSKCHKKCSNNTDCPQETPYCLGKDMNVEDMQQYEYLCFSEE